MIPSTLSPIARNVEVGIVTVLYRSSEVISAFVRCLNGQTFKDIHVYFVENETANLACEATIRHDAAFNFTFVRNEANVGVAAGNNQGIDFFLRHKKSTYILFLNNDVEFGSTFIDEQVAILKTHDEVKAIAPKIFYYSDPERVWYAGGKISYLKGGVRHFGHNKRDKLVGRSLYKVTYAPTCSLMIEAGRLRESGVRMREELFVYADDYEFCRDLRSSNIAMYYAPTIALWHKISTSTGGSQSDFSRFYLTRNWVYLGLMHRNLAVLAALPFCVCSWVLRRRAVELSGMRDALRMIKQRRM